MSPHICGQETKDVVCLTFCMGINVYAIFPSTYTITLTANDIAKREAEQCEHKPVRSKHLEYIDVVGN